MANLDRQAHPSTTLNPTTNLDQTPPPPILPVAHLLPLNPLPPLSAFTDPPLSLLPPSHLLSIRDHYYFDHPLPPPSATFISRTTHLLNLHPNSTPPLSLLLPLSLHSPRSVLVAICQWAIRQTLPQRIHHAAQTLLLLGTLAFYPVLPSRQTILAHWFCSQLKLPLQDDDSLESRLSHFLALVVQCRNSNGVRLLRVRDWLQGLVIPLLRARCWDGLFVAVKAVDEVGGEFQGVCQGLGEVVRGLGAMVSAEKRWEGEMDAVEKGMECLRVLGSKFRGEGRGAGWLVEWLMEGQVTESAKTMMQWDSVEGCEIVVIICAVRGEMDEVEQAARMSKGWEDSVWMTALARQMCLLTVQEVERLFGTKTLGFLVYGEGESNLKLARVGIRALTVLLVNCDVRESVCGDEGAPLRVLRGMCKAFLRVDQSIEKLCLFSYLYEMADRSCRPGVKYFDTHGDVLGRILTEVLLEMTRRLRGVLGGDSSCEAETSHEEVEWFTDIMKRRSNSPVCRNVTEYVTQVLFCRSGEQ